MNVGVILDTSCLITYLKRGDPSSLDVAELVFTVEENGDVTGIPALCVLAIYDHLNGDDRARLAELSEAGVGPTELLALQSDDVMTVAELATGMSQAQAHAVVAARRHSAVLATYEPNPARAFLSPRHLLDMGNPDEL